MRFDRVCSVTVGQAGEVGVEISGLHVIFTVSKSDSETMNEAKIEIYNANLSTANMFKAGNRLILSAGHSQETGALMLFSGDITRASRLRKGADIIWSIECLDGERSVVDKNIAVSFAAGTDGKKILKEISAELEMTIDQLDIPSGVLRNGFAFSGAAKDALSKITARLEMNWDIQDSNLRLYKPAVKHEGDTLEISSTSGMIGSPENVETAESTESGTPGESIPKIQVNCLLDGRIKIGSVVVLKSETINGKIYVSEIKHVGDTHGQEWTTTFLGVTN